MSFLCKLKQALLAVRKIPAVVFGMNSTGAGEVLKRESAQQQLLDLGRRLLVELKYQELRQKPIYRSHLHSLETPSGMESDKWAGGYSLERVSRKVNPRIIGHDLSKPILCMVCIGADYAKTVGIGTQSKTDYCQFHGYNMAVLDEMPYRYDRAPAWLKIPLIFRLMQLGYRRVFYLDADTVITNPKVLLEDFFERLEQANRHLMLSEDIFTLNTGSFLMRKTWQSLTLLDLIYETDAEVDHGFWEQQALIHLAEQNPSVRALLYLEPDSRQFNAMPFDGPPSSRWPSDYLKYAWQPGDFVCHLAGNRNKPDLVSKMCAIQGKVFRNQGSRSKLDGTGK
ncbi:MAG: hypothetical protein WC205_12615 [Opitutaceae bacterium]|jgi:hypothetical protein